MKKLYPIMTLFASAFAFASSASAVEWIFDNSKWDLSKSSSSLSLKDSLGKAAEGENAAVDGYWYYMNGDEKVYIQGNNQVSDTFKMDAVAESALTAGKTTALTLSVDQDFTCAGFQYGSAKYSASSTTVTLAIKGSTGAEKFTVTGDLKNTTTSQLASNRISNLNLHVDGNLDTGKFWAGVENLNGLYVGGNYIGNNVQPAFSSKVENSSITNPDAIVVGVIDDPQWFSVPQTGNVSSYYQVGGMVSIDLMRVFHSSYANNKINFIIKPTKGAVYNAGVAAIAETFGNGSNELAISVDPLTRSRAAFIMDAEAYDNGEKVVYGTQRFGSLSSSSIMAFSGGVTVKNGTMEIRFAQDATTYSSNGAMYQFRASYIRGENTAKKNYKVTYWTKDGTGGADAGVRAQFSHGDLVMEGGTFSSIFAGSGETKKDYGAFRFTNIIYSGGTIKLDLAAADKMDTIDLTSYYQRETEISKVNDVWTDVAGGEDWFTKEEGGTVKFANGVAEGTKVTFDLGTIDTLDWLIDAEDGSFTLNDGKGAKIIAWDSANKTALSESDFYAGEIGASGDYYRAAFTVADDGLYVKYVAVPEPSTYAAIFGSLALGFAVYRRRK